MSSGNPEADHILGGGFPANSINIVMGQPGSGQDDLRRAADLPQRGRRPADPLPHDAVRAAREGRPLPAGLPVLRRDRSSGTQVIYEDIGPQLAQRRIGGARSRCCEKRSRRSSPKIIVIDSFKAMHDLAPSVAERRRMVYELTALLTAYGTTAFLLGEYTEDDILRYPEFAVADGIVELSRAALGTRDERYFRVFKLRGSRYLEGAHAFRITDCGPRHLPAPGQPAACRRATSRRRSASRPACRGSTRCSTAGSGAARRRCWRARRAPARRPSGSSSCSRARAAASRAST